MKAIQEKAFASAFADAMVYQRFQKYIQNPDPVLTYTSDGARKGISLYVEMKKEPHVLATLQRRLSPVINCGHSVESASENPRDIEIAEFVEEAIADHYDDLARNILDAVPVGFSATEIIWKDGGRGIAEVKERLQNRFVFDKDGKPLLIRDYSNLVELPERKFIIATFNGVDDNRYGSGLMSSCFWPWWYKKHGIHFWSNYIEKYLQPFLFGKYPQNATPEMKDALMEAVEALQSDFAGIIPENSAIEALEIAARGNASSYKDFIEYMDRQISKAVLLSTLAIDEGEHGTRAQSETHAESTDQLLPDTAKFLQKILNQTVVRWLVDWNFETDVYPNLVVQYQDDLLSKEETDKILTLSRDGGLEVKVDDVYEKTQLTPPHDGDVVMAGGKVYIKGQKPVEPQNKPVMPGHDPDEKQEFSEESYSGLTALYQSVDALADKIFPAFKEEMIRAQDIRSLEKALGKVKDLAGLQKALESYKPNLEPVISEMLTLGRLMGLYEASRELEGQDYFDPQIDRARTVTDEDFLAVLQKLNLKDAINLFKKKIPVQKEHWKELSSEARAHAFYVAGIDNLVLVNSINEAILGSLESGKQFNEVLEEIRGNIEQVYGQKGLSSVNDHYLRTAYYTNLYSALNNQRYHAYRKAGVKALRYDTAGDSRVRAEHAKMHAFTAPIDDPVWDSWWPPNGFNCRCRVAPVRERESYPVNPGLSPDEGFDYNPAKASRQVLVEALKKHDRYQDYLFRSIRTWIGLKRPRLATLQGLAEPPATLKTPESFEEWRQLARQEFDQAGSQMFLETPDSFVSALGTNRVFIDDELLKHFWEDKAHQERIQHLRHFIETFRDPFEIWQVQRRSGESRFYFIGPFEGDKSAMVVVDGVKQRLVTAYFRKNAQIESYRKGLFLYGK